MPFFTKTTIIFHEGLVISLSLQNIGAEFQKIFKLILENPIFLSLAKKNRLGLGTLFLIGLVF